MDHNNSNYTIKSNSFIRNGHSQTNVTISTAENMIDEGWQAFDIGIVGPHINYTFKLLETTEIVIDLGFYNYQNNLFHIDLNKKTVLMLLLSYFYLSQTFK